MPNLTRRYPIVRKAVSTKTGAIRHIHKLKTRRSDPCIFCFYAEAANSLAYGDFMAGDRNSGAGLTEETALLATVGEFFERYCSAFVQERTILAPWSDISDTAVDPSNFALFSTSQYGETGFLFSPFTRSCRVAWVPAISASSNETVLVPAQMVYMPYGPLDTEALVAPQISHGLACHSSYSRAALLAILELIERDAFSLFWLSRRLAPRVTISSETTCQQTKIIRSIIGDTYFVENITYTIFDITNDLGIPTYFVIARSEALGETLVTVGAAARPKPADAIRKAFLEAAQARPYIRYIRDTESNWLVEPGYQNIRTFDEHARLYSFRPDLFDQIDFIQPQQGDRLTLDSIDAIGVVPSAEDDLRIVIGTLMQFGFEPLLVDLTTPDARDIGLTVVRAIVPGLHPLHGDHLIPFLGGSRLAAVQDASATVMAEPDVWRAEGFPHPFP